MWHECGTNQRLKISKALINSALWVNRGGGENRTPVRNAKPISLYMFIPNFKFTATAPPDWIL